MEVSTCNNTIQKAAPLQNSDIPPVPYLSNQYSHTSGISQLDSGFFNKTISDRCKQGIESDAHSANPYLTPAKITIVI